MSNELSIFSSGVAIPAHLQKKELSETTKALLGGALNNRRISIKGSVFRMMVGGNELAKNEDRSMNVIICAAAPKTSRQYYSGKYQDGNVSAPDCWSADGERPNKSIANPKNKTCEGCPMNVAGSGEGTSRACRYSHRIAVLLENDIMGDVYELSLSATSIFGKGENGKLPLFQYAKTLASHNMNVTDVVTEMRFDTNSPTPKLIFKAVRPLDEKEIEYVLEKGSSPEALEAITTLYVVSTPNEIIEIPEESPFDTKVSEPVVRNNPKKQAVNTPIDLKSTVEEWAND
jgi:hypothetical protein